MSQNQFVKVTRPFTVTKSLQEDGTFEGYASVYGIEDHHGDKVIKGAFSKGLQKLAKEKEIEAEKIESSAWKLNQFNYNPIKDV